MEEARAQGRHGRQLPIDGIGLVPYQPRGPASLATRLRREWQAPFADAPEVGIIGGYVHPYPLPNVNDPAEVLGTGADACVEANVQHEFISAAKLREDELLLMNKEVYENCGKGSTRLECLSKANYAESPRQFLAKCNGEGSPPFSQESGAVCRYSKGIMEDKMRTQYQYTHLLWLMNMAKDSCKATPLVCVSLITSCLGARDMSYCFRECVRTGSMDHALDELAAGPTAKYGEAPPMPGPGVTWGSSAA